MESKNDIWDNSSRSLELDTLKLPSPEFSPAYFWSLNDNLEKEVLLAQLQDMIDRGIRSICIHPLPSEFRPSKFACQLKPEYLSDEYFSLISEILRECEQKGLNAYLYDEGGWPSGGAAGRVMAQNPKKFVRKTIQICKKTGEIKVVEEKENIKTWPPYPNLLCGEATDAFIELTHERHKVFMEDHFGKTIKYTFTDEPAVPYVCLEGENKQLTWYDDLAENFNSQKGYDILPYVSRFFEEDRSLDTIKALVDYYDVWSKAFAERFLLPIKDWCRKNKLRSGGHFGGEDLPESNARAGFGHILRSLRELDLPGIDAIWRQIHPKNKMVFFPKYAQSIARQSQGDDLVLSESFMIYGNGLTPAEMKWVIDLQLVQGVTNFVFGHYSYSTRDHFMPFARPVFGPKNPFWKQMSTLHKYTERISWLLSCGKADCSLAVYYPVRDIWAGGEFQKKAIESHNQTALALLGAQCDFDFIDDDVLCIENIQANLLTVGASSYSTILVPETQWMSESALNALTHFQGNGGKVLVCGNETAADGGSISFGAIMRNAEKKPVIIRDISKISHHITPLVKVNPPCSDLQVAKRECANCKIYFIFNTADKELRANISFPEQATPLLYDFYNNSFSQIERFEFDFARAESKVIIFTESPEQFYPLTNAPSINFEPVLTLGDKWKIRALRQYIVGENDFEVKELPSSDFANSHLGDWKDLSMVGNEFSGELEYFLEFNYDKKIGKDRLFIDLGIVKYTAEIEINGTALPALIWPPFRNEITHCLKEGQNSLKIKVTNSLANALLKDNVLPKWKSNYGNSWPALEGIFYDDKQRNFEKDSLYGGLYGPVKIIVASQIGDLSRK